MNVTTACVPVKFASRRVEGNGEVVVPRTNAQSSYGRSWPRFATSVVTGFQRNPSERCRRIRPGLPLSPSETLDETALSRAASRDSRVSRWHRLPPPSGELRSEPRVPTWLITAADSRAPPELCLLCSKERRAISARASHFATGTWRRRRRRLLSRGAWLPGDLLWVGAGLESARGFGSAAAAHLAGMRITARAASTRGRLSNSR